MLPAAEFAAHNASYSHTVTIIVHCRGWFIVNVVVVTPEHGAALVRLVHVCTTARI